MPANMTTVEQTLLALARTEQPESILWLGQQPASTASHLAATQQQSTQLPAEQPRVDLVIVHHYLEHHSPAAGEPVIAKLRDLIAPKILVSLPTDDPVWTDQRMRALGFQTVHEPTDHYQFFGFDIHHYKQTPDWLNPKYWANPRMWDKHRW